MDKEFETIVKKGAKIAGVTCLAAGAVALMTSAAALTAMVEGAKYLKDAVKKIIDEEPKAEPAAEPEVAAEEPAAEEVPAEPEVAAEEPAVEEAPTEPEVTVEEPAAEKATEAETI